MLAKFIGKDGSMGLVHNSIYNIEICHYYGPTNIPHSVYIDRITHHTICEYDTYAALTKNWKFRDLL